MKTQEQIERRRAYKREHERKRRIEQGDHLRAKERQRYQNNPAAVLAKNKRSYLKHRKARLAHMAVYRSLHAAELRRMESLWRQNNRGRSNASIAGWKAKNHIPAWLTQEHFLQIRAVYQDAAVQRLEVDHIVPLRGETVCGFHVPWNLQLLTKSENSSKNNLTWPGKVCE